MIFKNPDEMVRGDAFINDSQPESRFGMGTVRANVCRHIWWEPSQVKVAIVTAGNLCPGTNSVIQGLTRTLWQDYGVRDILGMQNGYNGMSDTTTYQPIQLTPSVVQGIPMKG